MPKAPKDRKTPGCTLCNAHNATRTESHSTGTYPVCKRCKEGGLEYHGNEEAAGVAIAKVAHSKGVLPLEQRAHVGDPNIHKDGHYNHVGGVKRPLDDPDGFKAADAGNLSSWEAGVRSMNQFNDRRGTLH